MQYYIVIKDNMSQFLPFASLEAAKEYWNYLQTCEIKPYDYIGPTEEQKLSARQTFGKELLNEYLLDNDKIANDRGYPFSVQETGQQATKFQLVLGILPLGSLLQTLAVIEATPTDTIFTQERKDKYIAKLNQFLSTQ